MNSHHEASWVPATELLPESHKQVLLYIRWSIPEQKAYIDIGWWSPDHESFMHSEWGEVHATHWLPLPDPP